MGGGGGGVVGGGVGGGVLVCVCVQVVVIGLWDCATLGFVHSGLCCVCV